MRDPYFYPDTEILKNRLDIMDDAGLQSSAARAVPVQAIAAESNTALKNVLNPDVIINNLIRPIRPIGPVMLQALVACGQCL